MPSDNVEEIKDFAKLRASIEAGAEDYLFALDSKNKSSEAMQARQLKSTLSYHSQDGVSRAEKVIEALYELHEEDKQHDKLIALLLAIFSPKLSDRSRSLSPSEWLAACIANRLIQSDRSEIQAGLSCHKRGKTYSPVFSKSLVSLSEISRGECFKCEAADVNLIYYYDTTKAARFIVSKLSENHNIKNFHQEMSEELHRKSR